MLELLYTNLLNPEYQPKEEKAYIFSTKKLTEEEQTLLDNKNKNFINTFYDYGSDGFLSIFDRDMNKIQKSSDPETIFSRSSGYRWTLALHVPSKSKQEEMGKRVANEDTSDMELKKQRLKWYVRSSIQIRQNEIDMLHNF